MGNWLRSVFAGRPAWMNVLMVFCAYMAFIYVPWDFFVKPVAVDEEVWFGIMFRGWGAKAAEPLHWAVYAAGAYGFRSMKSWMWPWAAVYAGQVAVGMLVWNLLYGVGGFGGAVAFLALGALAVALWRARPLFERARAPLSERYGGWALVTGASAGLGVEFARALARNGIPCALSARREDRLRALASELANTYQVETRVIPADLADPAEVDRLADAVADLDLAILVNNAGFGHAGRFEKLDLGRLREMVEVNCSAPVALTSRLLPRLLERRRGAIVITGSVAGRVPMPFHGVYSATKAFDQLFGEALAVEVADQGIDVLVLEPGPTDTEFQAVAGEIPHGGESAAEVVAVAFEALGRQPSVVPGWKNWLRVLAATRLFPRPLVAQVARGVVEPQIPEDMR
jgi:short-subunit dehydrogenase